MYDVYINFVKFCFIHFILFVLVTNDINYVCVDEFLIFEIWWHRIKFIWIINGFCPVSNISLRWQFSELVNSSKIFKISRLIGHIWLYRKIEIRWAIRIYSKFLPTHSKYEQTIRIWYMATLSVQFTFLSIWRWCLITFSFCVNRHGFSRISLVLQLTNTRRSVVLVKHNNQIQFHFFFISLK